MRHTYWIIMLAFVAAAGLSACNESRVSEDGSKGQGSKSTAANTLTVPAGTTLEVQLGTTLSSETASNGTAWTGTVISASPGIPSGSAVSGIVTSVKEAKRGDRAMLDLGLTAIIVDGTRYDVSGGTEPIIAGSTRARNLGAIAGSAAAGAIIGKAVSGTGKGTIVGAVAGGGVATGVVAASDGYQVALKPGIALAFTTSEAVAVRR